MSKGRDTARHWELDGSRAGSHGAEGGRHAPTQTTKTMTLRVSVAGDIPYF
ncbi:MAG: hypothetical protein PVF58_17205 [Candidatus Methanofastidiosia archaeon]